MVMLDIHITNKKGDILVVFGLMGTGVFRHPEKTEEGCEQCSPYHQFVLFIPIGIK